MVYQNIMPNQSKLFILLKDKKFQIGDKISKKTKSVTIIFRESKKVKYIA